MTVYLEVPIDKKVAAVHGQLPELRDVHSGSTMFVPEGQCLTGDKKAQFVSQGFSVCSALLLQNDTRTRFGLFHIYPEQEPDAERDVLLRMRRADGVLVIGTESTPKTRIFSELVQRYDIKLGRTIYVDTVRKGITDLEVASHPFHIVYRPRTNTVFVARISHGDILQYHAF